VKQNKVGMVGPNWLHYVLYALFESNGLEAKVTKVAILKSNVLLSSVSVYILCTLFLFEDSIIPIQIRCYKFTHNFILRPSDLKYTAETILNEIINVLIWNVQVIINGWNFKLCTNLLQQISITIFHYILIGLYMNKFHNCDQKEIEII
jgi:hypothetical protein